MFWGSISGRHGKGPTIYWDKSWGKINSQSYCEHIIPLIKEYLAINPGLLFQQDNAAGHASAYTKLFLVKEGIYPILQPLFSPDLNPIETVQDQLKDLIEIIDPEVYSSYKRLQKVVEKAWEQIDEDKIRALCSGEEMRKRCQAVIDANGIYTKF